MDENSQRDQSSHKLPSALAFLVVGLAVTIFAVLTSRWAIAVLGGIGTLGFVVITVNVLLGRNPRWMRFPLDPRRASDKE